MYWLEEGPWEEKRRAELIELFFLCVYRKTDGNTLSAGLCSIKEMWVFDVKTKDLAGLRAQGSWSHESPTNVQRHAFDFYPTNTACNYQQMERIAEETHGQW